MTGYPLFFLREGVHSKQTNKMNSLYSGVFMAISNMGLYGLNQGLGSNQEKVYLNACHLT